nr:MAG TPA: hypothetical protein [Caudoviricetes sp.]
MLPSVSEQTRTARAAPHRSGREPVTATHSLQERKLLPWLSTPRPAPSSQRSRSPAY